MPSEDSDEAFGLSAKIKIEAKTEVPSKATGRVVEAIADLLSPFTEGLGAIGDKVRLYREDTLLEIATRARKRAEVEKAELTPPPLKFLIQFFERASAEEKDSVLCDMWANLLCDASDEFADRHFLFLDILSSMTKSSAAALKGLVPSNIRYKNLSIYVRDRYSGGFGEDFANLSIKSKDQPQLYRKLLILHLSGKKLTPKNIDKIPNFEFEGDPWRDSDPDVHSEIADLVRKLAKHHAVRLMSHDVEYSADSRSVWNQSHWDAATYANLQRNMLAETVTKTFKVGKAQHILRWMLATPLGVEFLEACGREKILYHGEL